MSLEKPRTSSEDHQALTEEDEEDLLASKEEKSADKAPITSAFNALNPFSWLH